MTAAEIDRARRRDLHDERGYAIKPTLRPDPNRRLIPDWVDGVALWVVAPAVGWGLAILVGRVAWDYLVAHPIVWSL